MEATASVSMSDGRSAASHAEASTQPPDALVRAMAIAVIRTRHRDTSFSVEVLAHELHVSVRHLHRCFAGHESVGRLIARSRALAAEMLLIHDPAASNGEIALRAGFSSPATMRAHLQRHTGNTPRELRQALSSAGRDAGSAPASSAA